MSDIEDERAVSERDIDANNVSVISQDNINQTEMTENNQEINHETELHHSSRTGSLNSAFMVKSGDILSVHAGTSRKGSNSCRNIKFLLKMESDLNLNDFDLDYAEKMRLANRRKITSKSRAETKETLRTQRSFESTELAEIAEDELDNEPQLMTFEQKEIGKEKNKIIKKSMITVLLTHRWQKMNLKKRHAEKTLVMQNTYRMGKFKDHSEMFIFVSVKMIIILLEPVVNVRNKEMEITSRLYTVFEILIEKHSEYNIEYTPRFLRVMTEILKNECKQFKLERYKIICHMIIIEKLHGQSIKVISRMLVNNQTDKTINLKHETGTYYILCSVHFIYHE